MTDPQGLGRSTTCNAVLAFSASAVVAAVALIAISSSSVAKPTSSAVAASSPTGPCAGALIERRFARAHRHGKLRKVGELVVYYDSATGKNCARMNHYGPTVGRPRFTMVELRICRGNHRPGRHCRRPTRGVRDAGRYSYYAGPVTTKQSARGRCIQARGYLRIPFRGSTLTMEIVTRPPVGHCGA